jgi:hypothetical protein
MKQFDYNKYRKNNPLLKEGYTPDERIYVGEPSKTGPLAVASDYLYSMEKALKQLDRVIDSNPDISAKSVIKMVLKTLNDIKAKQKGGDPSMQGDFSMNEDTNRIVQDALADGGYVRITPKTKVTVGKNVLSLNGYFGEITKIQGDKYKISDDDGYDFRTVNREKLEKNYLIEK